MVERMGRGCDIKTTRHFARAAMLVCLALAPGCIHVPAQSVATDRFDYGQSLSDSWKEQTLANVVRLRYADAPAFLEVTSVINVPPS